MKIHSYRTAGGKDLIMEYIKSLSKPEAIDGLSVMEHFKNNEFDELDIKQ